jgi:GTP-binding protein
VLITATRFSLPKSYSSPYSLRVGPIAAKDWLIFEERSESRRCRARRRRTDSPPASRGLFGYRTEFLTDTRGEGTLYRSVRGYEPLAGELTGRGVGAIIASETGRSTTHALFSIQERATMFIGNGENVYEGRIVGENRRDNDMNVNVTRAKKLTNVRNTGHDDAQILTPPRRFTIESALEWIESDELLEVTPQSLRLRKRVLPANLRKR